MTKTLTLRVDHKTYGLWQRRARAENRSLSNYIETDLMAHIRECAFADKEEMTEILSDEPLRRVLRRGSRDARRRKGRFVD